ncbi:MAG: helix-turn-helix domain-containing protein [Clostridia bacterium]|nr:helix-turn-helix domain-containing protein [Clostridia bacterium]
MKTYLFEALRKNDDSTIHIFRSTNTPTRSHPATFNPHQHDFIELVYVVAGSALQVVNEERYEVQRGDLIFINYGSTHAFMPHEPFTYVNICFKPETLAKSVITPENAFAVLQLTAFDEIRRESDESMISFTGDERDEIERTVLAMEREYTERGASWRTMLESYMNILIVRLLRRVRLEVSDKAAPDIWTELSTYIDDNLGSDLTLPTLAGKCFYNPSYFSRVFKDRFEMSLTEYINRRRIEHALRLLEETTLSGEEIAARAGFSSKSSFYRVFTKHTGCSPSEYRQTKVKK